MAGIRRAKIYSRERVNLGDVLPLEIPFSVQIDICSVCNMQCKFCFHSDLDAIKKYNVHFGYMKMEDYIAVIDNIKTSIKGKIKKLKLFKIGEPLLNPYVVEMIKYAKEADIAEIIEITTNGVLLDEKLSKGVIEAGLDILNISVNGLNSVEYKHNCNLKIDYEKFIDNIKYFYNNRRQCKVFIKYSDMGLDELEKDRFYKIFENICDEIFVENIISTLWQDTEISNHIENRNEGIYGQVLGKKKVCPFLFTTMVINHEGISHLCCVDWKSEYILGDMKKTRLSDIWNGEKIREIQKIHLLGNKDKIKICRNCESLNGSTIDNIDGCAEKILLKI